MALRNPKPVAPAGAILNIDLEERFRGLETFQLKPKERKRRPPGSGPIVPVFPHMGEDLPLAALAGHLTIIGSPAAGKTLLLKLVMNGLLRFLRGFIVDQKLDLLATIVGVVGPTKTANMHVFDDVAFAWDLDRDLETPADVREFCAALIPLSPDNPQSRFWDKNSRNILFWVIMGLKKLGRLNLRNIICALSEDQLFDVLNLTEGGRRVYRNVLKVEGNSMSDRKGGLLASLSAHLDELMPVAQASEHHLNEGRGFSLTDWVAKTTPETVIRLGIEEQYSESLNLWIGTMFRFVSKKILSRRVDLDDPDFLFMFDELQAIADVVGELPRFMAASRTKGAAVVAATQSIPGLRLAFGNHDAPDAILSHSVAHAFLRTDSLEGARVASEYCGKQEFVRKQPTKGRTVTNGYTESFAPSDGGPRKTTTYADSIAKSDSDTVTRHLQDLVQPSVFLDLPVPSPSRGLTGFFRHANRKLFITINGDWITRRLPMAANIVPPEALSTELTDFKEWTDDEREELFYEVRLDSRFFAGVGRQGDFFEGIGPKRDGPRPPRSRAEPKARSTSRSRPGRQSRN